MGGKIVAMPVYLTSTGLGYNKALLKEAGVAEPPKTWDDVIRVGKLLTKDTRGTGRPNQWGFGCELSAASTPNPVSFTMPMIRSLGGQIVDKDGKGLMNTPEHQRIAKLLADLYNDHKIMAPESMTMKANDEVDLFGAKAWAMGIVIHALLPPTLEKMGADNFGFAPYPVYPGNEPRSYSEVYGFLISARAAKDPRKGPAAFELLKAIGAVRRCSSPPSTSSARRPGSRRWPTPSTRATRSSGTSRTTRSRRRSRSRSSRRSTSTPRPSSRR